MNCPNCGCDNKTKFKFCVSCGSNLEDPSKVNIEQVERGLVVDRGGYKSEKDSLADEYTESGGTFVINNFKLENSSGIFTADELNDSIDDLNEPVYDPVYEELELPKYRQESPKPETASQRYRQEQRFEPAAVRTKPETPDPELEIVQPDAESQSQQPFYAPAAAVSQPQPQYQQPYTTPYVNQQYMNQPQQVYGQPMYSQPQQMYGQAILMGYDSYGMPVYMQQPVMQPQLIGYDCNGIPIYAAQPVVASMYQQPVHGVMYQTVQTMPGMMQHGVQPPMPGMMAQGVVQPGMMPQGVMPQQTSGAAPQSEDDEDFYVQRRGAYDVNGYDKKKTRSMRTVPDVDVSLLPLNNPNELNKYYMRTTAGVHANDLEANTEKRARTMRVTDTVNAEELPEYENKQSKGSMRKADKSDASQLQPNEQIHISSIMKSADKAVEALPKKKVDEIDAIILPEQMQAKKTIKEAEIPILVTR